MSEDNPRPGSLYYRALDDGWEIVVYEMTFGKARVCLCRQEDPFAGIEKGYCYEDPMLARAAAALWDGQGDPIDGWHREVFSGRRRPGGDPAKEHVHR